MTHCKRGHVRVADKQRRCIECRRGYDVARNRHPLRLASQRRYREGKGRLAEFRYRHSALGVLTDRLIKGRKRIATKRQEIESLTAELEGLHG